MFAVRGLFRPQQVAFQHLCLGITALALSFGATRAAMRLLLSVFPLLALAKALSPPQSFVNTAIARTVELGGATTSVNTQFNVKANVDGPGDYWLALAGDGQPEPAWWEVKVAGQEVEVKAMTPTDAR